MTSEDRKKILKTIILWSVILGAIISLFIPIIVNSQNQNGIRPFDPCQAGGCITSLQSTNGGKESILVFLLGIAKYMIYILSAVSLVYFVWGGWVLVIGETEKKQKEATAILTWSLLGLIIAASSFTAVSAVISFMSGIIEEGGSQAPVSFIGRIK